MTEIDYEVRRSEKATKPRIDIDIHSTRVILPENSDLEPADIVEKKREWIEKKRSKFEEQKEEAPERSFEEGEVFYYKGEPHSLTFQETSELQVEEGQLIVPEKDREKVEETLEEFFKSKAQENIDPVVKEYGERLNVNYNQIAFRNQRTLWGSCSPKQNLSFNWRLIMAPESVQKYVVIHELAHLKERNHTKKFWRIVEEHHENYKESSEWLKEKAPKLIFRKEDL